jgi:hypothetical protein
MTNVDSRPSESPRSTYPAAPEVTGWTGWVLFAAVMMALVGCTHIVQGLVAVFSRGFYVVQPSGLVIHADYTAWGWVHIVLGVVIFIAALFLPTGALWARILAVAFAVVSVLTNLLFISAYPIWSVIVIAVDVVVIFAITVHGKELKTSGV